MKDLCNMTKSELLVLIRDNGIFVEDSGLRVSNPNDIVAKFVEKSDKNKEGFFVATLNSVNKLIKVHKISVGTINRSLVHPREVFIEAIKDNSASIIIGHNHPSGSVEPSPEDLDVTSRLKKAGEILGITVLDHVIVTKCGKNFSLLENNVF